MKLSVLTSVIVFNLELVCVLQADDVKQHGAVGDGHADDTVAIQRAVEEGGQVTFSSGTDRISKTIRVQLDKTG